MSSYPKVTSSNTTNIVNSNVWSHVAVTIDKYNSNINFYINGELVSSETALNIGDMNMQNSNYVIGYDGTSTYYDGSLDDVALYYGLLNTTTISSLADSTVNPNYDPKLITGYRFDTLGGVTVFDESLNSNHGTMINSVDRLSPSYTEGNVCLEFESISNQYVIAPSSSESDFNQSTLCAWVNTSNDGNAKTILHKEGCFTWSIDGNGYQSVNVANNSYQSTSTISDNTWTHISATIDQFNSKVSFFTDGSFTSSNDNVSLDVPQNSSNLFIGWDSNTTYYNGKIDDVLIYDEVLGNNTISTLGNLSTQSSYYTTSSNIPADTWTHIAATYDNENGIIQLYHNSSNVASYSNYNVNVGSNENVITIGRSDPSTYFDGMMDDIRIYDKILNSTSLSNLYGRYFLNGNGG